MSPTASPSGTLEDAYRALREGRFVLLYDADGREEEVDIFVAAQHATPPAVRALRRDAGGLVFLAVDPNVGQRLGLPFLQDIFADAAAKHPVMARLIPNDIAYDTRSSFSVTLNHRDTFTGITDNDRSLTITRFAALAERTADKQLSDEAVQADFGVQFRAPGHVHLCVGAGGLLRERQGHTELAVALARLAGITPVVAGAEMLGDDGRALPKKAAFAWAEANGGVMLEGKDIIAAWEAQA